MFENITKRFERNKSTDDLYVYTEKYQVDVVATFRKTYTVRALDADDAQKKVVEKLQKQNKTYSHVGLHFIKAKAEKTERIKDD